MFAELSFALPAGAALLLTGANGAGKSTLLRILSGLLRPADGAVFWHGADIAADPAAHAARLRYLSHQDALKPALTVAENLAFFAALWGGAVAPALAAVALDGLADLPARVLSSGQKRRLALARLALAPAPLWLLDEPYANLDLEGINLVNRMISAHLRDGGAALVTTHGAYAAPPVRTRMLRLGEHGVPITEDSAA